MRSYCVKQKKETSCVPGSERIKTAKNGRNMSVCICSECGITKTKFIAGKTGGAMSKSDFSCGYDLKGKRAGTAEECFKKGQIRRWGINKLDDGYIDALLADRTIERNEKARARRKSKPKVSNALVPYIDPYGNRLPTRVTIYPGTPEYKRLMADKKRKKERKKEKKKSKRENTKAHIKEVINKIQPGDFIELEDDIVINTDDGYGIVNINSISDDELMDIDWSDPNSYEEYLGGLLSKTETIDLFYDMYKKKKKIKLPGN